MKYKATLIITNLFQEPSYANCDEIVAYKMMFPLAESDIVVLHSTKRIVYTGGHEKVVVAVMAVNNDGMDSEVAQTNITTPELGK